VDEIEQGILSLEQMPNRCPERQRGAYAKKGYRQLLVKNYTVVFRVDAEKRQVVIVTVRYAKSQF
jgi:plasmid stabilization system protein ParE